MPATEPFTLFVNINPAALSKEESLLLEMELFASIIDELKTIFMRQHQDYFRLLKSSYEMESTMIDQYLIRYIINDILATEEYSVSGIAYYTQTPEDLIYEMAAGLRDCLSLSMFQRIVSLHRFVRQDLYQEIMRKCQHKIEAAL